MQASQHRQHETNLDLSSQADRERGNKKMPRKTANLKYRLKAGPGRKVKLKETVVTNGGKTFPVETELVVIRRASVYILDLI